MDLLDLDSNSSPLFSTRLVQTQKHGQLIDLSYRADQWEEHASAWLIAPHSRANSSYVVFLHGGGQDRGVFIEEALSFAETGIIALLIDLPQARQFPAFTQPEDDIKTFQQTVSIIQRGIDCLIRHYELDDKAGGGIIGFSFGAWMGILLATLDRRLKSAALTAVVPRMSEFWRASLHPEVVRLRANLPGATATTYADLTRPIDAIEQIGRRDDLRLLLQFGSGDEFVTEQDRQKFLPFVSRDRSLRVYKSDSHLEMFLNGDARRDRFLWLREELLKKGAASAR